MKNKIRIIVSLTMLMITCVGFSASAEELNITSFRNQVVGTNSNVNIVNMNVTKQIGWKKVNDLWCYFDSFGEKQTGWLKDNGKWYYLDQSGIMLHDTIVDGYRLGSAGTWIV